MVSRREHGAPSALTVLEVAEGLRWTDPALGASLAEHVRRLAGDDPAVRAAADRSMIRSLEESDRHEDVVERGVPLLAEARERGDRDDGAAVLVELAMAATGLGDPGLARRLLDRLGAVAELPARIGVAACAARAEACAAEGDVAGTDAAGDEATPTLLRVPQPDSTIVQARLGLARGVARRRSGDVDGALDVFTRATSSEPADDIDGGRRSLLAAAEATELLVEAGRHDEARARARAVLPDGAPAAHVSGPVGRIRLALAVTSEQGTTSATTVAEDLESTGRTAEAARAWELAAGVAEARGDLGQALSALRRGHGLASRARDAADRALRALASVADGADPLASPVASGHGPGTPEGQDPPAPTRRRERRNGVEPEAGESRPPVVQPEWPAPALDAEAPRAARPGDERVAEAPVGPVVQETVSAPGRAATDAGTSVSSEPARGDSGSVPRSSTRDELAELLASLTRSVDSSRAAASGMGLEPAPAASSASEPDQGEPADPEVGRRSRHSAFPVPTAHPVAEPSASRPTFDAFSTAPLQRITDDGTTAPPVAPLPDDRFAPAGEGAGHDTPRRDDSKPDPDTFSVSDLVDPLADPLSPGAPGVTGTSTAPPGAPDRAEREVAPPAGADAVRRDDTGTATGAPRSAGSDTAPGSARSVSSAGPSTTGRVAREDRDADRRDADRRYSDDAVIRSSAARADAMPTGRGHSSPDAAEPSAPARNGTPPGGASGDGSSASVRRRGETERADARTSDRSPTPSAVRAGGDERTGLVAAAGGPSRPAPEDQQASSTGARGATARPVDEYAEELALTLATVLGEYHLPDVAMPVRRDRDRDATSGEPPDGTSATDVAVPSARRHTSGSMPVPGDQRWAPRPESAARPGSGEPVGGRTAPSSNGRGRPPESGARLADLLAEAMDAFRHVGPEAQDGARGPGVGSRRA